MLVVVMRWSNNPNASVRDSNHLFHAGSVCVLEALPFARFCIRKVWRYDVVVWSVKQPRRPVDSLLDVTVFFRSLLKI